MHMNEHSLFFTVALQALSIFPCPGLLPLVQLPPIVCRYSVLSRPVWGIGSNAAKVPPRGRDTDNGARTTREQIYELRTGMHNSRVWTTQYCTEYNLSMP